MKGLVRNPGAPPSWAATLGVTLGIQAVLAIAMRTLPVIGPELTAAAGMPPENVGILVGVTSAGSMLFLLTGTLPLRYWGSVRLLQIGSLVAALGMLAGLAAAWWLLLVAAFLIGIGYGPTQPAASEILTRTSPARHLSLIMSIKQAGVPLGGAIAGILLPALTVWADWRAGMLAIAMILAAGAAGAQPWRGALDADRNAAALPPTIGNMFSRDNLTAPFRVLGNMPGMPELMFASFCFALVQGCIFAFFVTQLTTELGFSLSIAGASFSVMQASGACARVGMGWLADRFGGMRTMLLLAFASVGMVLVLSGASPFWPVWLVVLVGFALGVTSISWNGVFLAMVAQLAPRGRIGEATAGATFFIFLANTLAPLVFAIGVPRAGGYGACFAVVAAVQALALPALLRLRRKR